MWAQGSIQSSLPAHHASQLNALCSRAAFIPQVQNTNGLEFLSSLCRGGDRVLAACKVSRVEEHHSICMC